LALFRDADYYILDALNEASEDIVDEFLDVTSLKIISQTGIFMKNGLLKSRALHVVFGTLLV